MVKTAARFVGAALSPRSQHASRRKDGMIAGTSSILISQTQLLSNSNDNIVQLEFRIAYSQRGFPGQDLLT